MSKDKKVSNVQKQGRKDRKEYLAEKEKVPTQDRAPRITEKIKTTQSLKEIDLKTAFGMKKNEKAIKIRNIALITWFLGNPILLFLTHALAQSNFLIGTAEYISTNINLRSCSVGIGGEEAIIAESLNFILKAFSGICLTTAFLYSQDAYERIMVLCIALVYYTILADTCIY